FELCYQLPAPVERVWPILADTDRLNRSIGLPPTQAVAAKTERVRDIRVRARMFGVPLEWDEAPFAFVENEYYWVRRRMLRGRIRARGGPAVRPGAALGRGPV